MSTGDVAGEAAAEWVRHDANVSCIIKRREEE